MSEYILNMLPINPGEQGEFEAIAPGSVHQYTGRKSVTPEQLASATVILGWPRPEDLSKAPKLKWFHSMWSGTDEYQAPGIVPSGVTLTSSRGTNRRSVAEHMLACLLSLYRKLPQYRDAQLQRRWQDEGAMRTLCNSTVLVVGAGSVGATFAQFCRGLGATTIGLRRSPAPAEGFDRVCAISQLDELLPQADVVALVLPHTPETAGLMDARRIAMMRDDAVLLNFGRGTALDLAALYRAMEQGKLWGAAVDVTEPEPLPQDSPLWAVPNLILTPHVGGGMRLELTRRACIELAQENLRRYLANQPMENVVRLP